MKNIIITLTVLLSFASRAQTIIGINIDAGSSKIVNEFQSNLSPENVTGGNAFGIAANVNFLSTKRFNPKVNFGVINKNSSSTRDITYQGYDSFGNPAFITEDITTRTSINNLRLDVGVRFNVFNKKNKLFIDLGVNNNYILTIKNYRNATTFGPATKFETKPTNAYYAGFIGGVGYNYNNVLSVAIQYNPSLTYYDTPNQSRVNMWGLNVCYYLPILANSKSKKEAVAK